MRMLRAYCAVGLTAILVASHLAAAGAQAMTAGGKPASARKADAASLLANVTHLTENDVRFRTRKGISVFVDPMVLPTSALASKTGMVKPDLILITHLHQDHFNPVVLLEYGKRNPNLVLAGPADVIKAARANGIKTTMAEVQPGRDYTLAGIGFRTVPAYFLEDPSHPKERGWVGYVLKIDGVAYYVTGDTQPLPEMADVKADVLFPLVYGCGGNVDPAIQMVAMCKPSLVVPVHTGGDEEVIRDFLARLPKGVQGAYYTNGTLVVGPGTASK
jgi:L-ascorbate metabolism protein UlaG (beta-lactamase superfamily)